MSISGALIAMALSVCAGMLAGYGIGVARFAPWMRNHPEETIER